MKNIAFDCERMKYQHTGLFYYCLNLGLHLKKYVNSSEEKLAFFMPRGAKRYFGNDVKYLDQSSLKKYFMPSLKDYSLWHANFQDTRYLPMRNRQIKVVLSIHDMNFMYEKAKEEKRQQYLKRLQKNIYRSDAIICISEYSKNDVMKHCDTSRSKVYVIHNGSNALEIPHLDLESFRPKGPYLFSIGVINRKKNFHSLLPLMQKLEELELVIAGRIDDVEYYKELLAQARALKISDRVKILENISEQEKSWYYNNCLAFLMPSLAEGFGLPVVEAMSLGKPTFLANATALPEIGSDKAFYFRDFEANNMNDVFRAGMEQYSTNNMAAEIVSHAQNFSWDRAAQEYWAVYRSLL